MSKISCNSDIEDDNIFNNADYHNNSTHSNSSIEEYPTILNL